MKKIGNILNYDLYVGADQAGKPIYNAALVGTPEPMGGYYDPAYICNLKKIPLDVFSREMPLAEALKKERSSIIKQLKELNNYPMGPDTEAPWNEKPSIPQSRKKIPMLFRLHSECEDYLILEKEGKLYAFYLYQLDEPDIREIAIDFVGVPSEPSTDEDGTQAIYDTSEYRTGADLPSDAIVKYINDNIGRLTVGVGMDGMESGADLIEIDQAVKEYLLSLYHSLKF